MSSRTRRAFLPRLLAVAMITALACATQLRLSSTAFADGTCGPYQNGLSTYQNQGCVYSFGNTPPYVQNAGDFVYIDYMLDGGFPTNIYNDIQAAVTNWTNSGANIRFTQVYYYDGQQNFLEITPSTSGAGFTTNCQTSTYGQSWAGPGSSLYHQVLLNSLLFSQSCGTWDTTWIGVAVHEMGHAFGLAHNLYCYYCSTSTPINARMLGGQGVGVPHLLAPPSSGTCSNGGSCTRIQVVNPQVTDYWIFNQIYPNYPTLCASSQASNFYCNGMDPALQNCTGNAGYLQEVDTPYGWEQIWWSNSCQTNWTKGASYSGWKIYRIQLNRGSGSDGGAFTIEDTPNLSTWYTNMAYSPNNHDQSCISFISTDGGTITQWYCTSWH